MKTKTGLILTIAVLCACGGTYAKVNDEWCLYAETIREYIHRDYKSTLREAEGGLKYPFIVPGSVTYNSVLWDWDSFWTDVAIRQILLENNDEQEKRAVLKYEQGCVLNFLEFASIDGAIPFRILARVDSIDPNKDQPDESGSRFQKNMHKAVLAQHAAFLIKENGGDASWLKEKFHYLKAFVDAFYIYYRDETTGLYFFIDDRATGTDNDPTQYQRPDSSTATPYVNAFIYKELKAMIYLCNQLGDRQGAEHYAARAEALVTAMRQHSWDPQMGYYFSVDLNLRPIDRTADFPYPESGDHYDALVMRIMTWTGFCTMWAEIATPEQAEIMVNRHFHDQENLNSDYGIRTLSQQENSYFVGASGNPSSWLGPIWIISNYMTFQGLVHYGYTEEAKEIASETVVLLGRDIKTSGAMHEYYLPSNGEPLLNKGFLNWNCLVLNMLAYLEGAERVEEF